MLLGEIFYSVAANKCPRCHSGQVFVSNNPYDLHKGLSMYENCSHCHLKYEAEPGYFYGAMYVSYALTVGYGVLSWLVFWLINGTVGLELLWFLLASWIILIPVTFRWSRTLWMNFFTRFQPSMKKKIAESKEA